MFSRLKALLAILALACTGFLVACGDEDEGPSASAGGDAAPGNLTLVADASGTPAWEPTELSAKAGEVTVTLDNPSPVAHDVAIEGDGVEEKSDLVTDDTTSVTANLKPGEYKYYCTVPGHEESGMTGTLTVE